MALVAVGIALVVSGCATSPTSVAENPSSGSQASATTTHATTPSAHAPFWIDVKYRPDPVDVADPRFVYLDGGSSSLVDAAFYDAGNRYMIISLDGTAYHYCGTPQSAWSQFAAASSLGSFYRDRIKGNYDCRTGVVPQY